MLAVLNGENKVGCSMVGFLNGFQKLGHKVKIKSLQNPQNIGNRGPVLSYSHNLNEYWTRLDFEWSEVVWMTNALDFECHTKIGIQVRILNGKNVVIQIV